MSPTSATRGRPVEIDPDHLEKVAIELFQRHGYDAVSAAEVAEAAGVSRRSLFRYFPTKADLVWRGFAQGLDVLSEALAHQPATGDPRDAVCAALLTTAEGTPELDDTRARLRIIATHPDLIAFGSGQLHEQSVIILSYLMDRGVDELEARVLGDALSLSAFNGYVHWALRGTDDHPRESVRKALEVICP